MLLSLETFKINIMEVTLMRVQRKSKPWKIRIMEEILMTLQRRSKQWKIHTTIGEFNVYKYYK